MKIVHLARNGTDRLVVIKNGESEKKYLKGGFRLISKCEVDDIETFPQGIFEKVKE